MTFQRIGPLRVPIVAAAVLVYLPLAAILPPIPGSSLARGLFDLTALTPGGGFGWVLRTFATFFFAWLALGVAIVAVYQSAAMIHDFAPARFKRPAECAVPSWLGLSSVTSRIIVAIPAVLAMAASLSSSLDGEDPPSLTVGVAASLAAIAVLRVLTSVTRRCASLQPAELNVVRRVFARFASRFDTSGYEDPAAQPPCVDPLPHHVWAALFLFFSCAVLLLVGVWAFLPSLQPAVRVPALCSLYLLVMVMTWGLCSLTFFLDYYRIPVLTLLLLPAGVVGATDYLHEARSAPDQVRMLLPAEVVAPRIAQGGNRIVAISAAGGGIQAAAWTARVLEGLLDDAAERRDAFLQRIVVLSGVSGGSVGVAPFVLALAPQSRHLLGRPITEAVSSSSLDQVAATWVTLDLVPFRNRLPFRLGPDRGQALQNAWAASWAGIGLSSDVALSALARDVVEGTKPAFMFNATSMNTGERLLLGTTVPTKPRRETHSFLQAAVVARGEAGLRRPEYEPTVVVSDIDVATAARLSATFPLVSPATRCRDCAGTQQYVVDGGYVDNSGVESLADWIEALLLDPKMGATSVTMIQIVPFSEDDCSDAPRAAESQPDETPRDGGARNLWAPSQLAVLLRTLYGVRAPVRKETRSPSSSICAASSRAGSARTASSTPDAATSTASGLRSAGISPPDRRRRSAQPGARRTSPRRRKSCRRSSMRRSTAPIRPSSHPRAFRPTERSTGGCARPAGLQDRGLARGSSGVAAGRTGALPHSASQRS